MASRIEIELTSARDDGTWTWRAAGAKQPKGVLDAKVLYEGAKVGDVVRADAEFEIDGITVITVLPPKSKRAEPERIELIGPPRVDEPGVQLVPAAPDRRRPRRDDDGRERRPPRQGSRDRDRDRDGAGRERPDRPRRDRPAEPRPAAARTERRERPARPARAEVPAPPPKPKPRRLQP